MALGFEVDVVQERPIREFMAVTIHQGKWSCVNKLKTIMLIDGEQLSDIDQSYAWVFFLSVCTIIWLWYLISS